MVIYNNMKKYRIDVFKLWLWNFRSNAEKRVWKKGIRPPKNNNHGKH